MSESVNKGPKRIEAVLGPIEVFAQTLIETSRMENREVEGKFNGVILRVLPNESRTAEDLVKFYYEEMNRQQEEYRKSPAGINAAALRAAKVKAAQEKIDHLVGQLDSIDFGNLESVIDWLVAFQNPSDTRGVSYDRKKVVETFKNHGFEIGANEGNLKKADRDNFGRYIVGQALKGINEYGAIHQVVHKPAEEWKAIYGKKVRAEQQEIEAIKKGLN